MERDLAFQVSEQRADETWYAFRVEAQLTMIVRPARPDGRHPSPPRIFSGYRCSNIYFDRRPGNNHLATFLLPNRDSIFPGETAEVVMDILGPVNFTTELHPGAAFEVLEVGQLVATGLVTAIHGMWHRRTTGGS